ncbi:MAG: hypothetical protein IPI44_07715 [Sulfuritalea sp.]|nr:hypothetical protein [Sulfuritalea sp.]
MAITRLIYGRSAMAGLALNQVVVRGTAHHGLAQHVGACCRADVAPLVTGTGETSRRPAGPSHRRDLPDSADSRVRHRRHVRLA